MTTASKKSKKSAAKAAEKEAPAPGQSARNIRETVESIVVAFVLAFLFRTFEAEAFVIPTGSMAPTLMGRHKDVYCSECGYRFQASASHEEDEQAGYLRSQLNQTSDPGRQMEIQQRIDSLKTVAATCPMCRWTQPFANLKPSGVEVLVPSYSGDRIIVSKVAYTFSDPERWDVVVFRYPGEAQQNYIKRMIGLPGETIRIYGGDIFVKSPDEPDEGGTEGDGFRIARKPPFKLLAIMQAVHDTRFFPVELQEAGWPFRWAPSAPDSAGDAAAWKSEFVLDEHDAGANAVQRFTTDGSGKSTAWIRYRHLVPDYGVWAAIQRAEDGELAALPDFDPLPQLITDYYAYNTDLQLNFAAQQQSLRPPASKLGLHWVGDLILECDVTVEASTDQLLLDLVEGGKHFVCTIDLQSGRATVAVEGVPGFSAAGDTPLNEPGTYRVRMANVDDRILLWVDDDLVDLGGPEGGAPYDVADVFGERKDIRPRTSPGDPGDLAPAGVGSRGAALTVENLRVLRDIYYIADRHDRQWGGDITDLPETLYRRLISHGNGGSGGASDYYRYLTDPDSWAELADLPGETFHPRSYTFELKEDQFFVLGDNSPASKDSRLWLRGEERQFGGRLVEVKRPGGHFVERRLLTGKALFVYWPHSWGTVPGTNIPLPFFPNVWDMRLVK